MESLTPSIARRLGVAAALVSVLAVPAAAEASATATVDVSANTVSVVAQPGETNSLRLVNATMPTTGAPAVRVVDSAGTAAGTGCQASGNDVYCPRLSKVVVDLGDGDDSLLTDKAFTPSIEANGGPGADVMYGGLGDDVLSGGAGDDTLQDARGGNDVFKGGEGSDTVTYEGYSADVQVTIGAGANDGGTVAGEADDVQGDVENVIGGKGWDNLVGGPGANRLDGLGGRDTVSGGAGDDALVVSVGGDTLDGGDDNDRFVTSPATVDEGTTFVGGSGQDSISYAGIAQSLTLKLDDVANDGPAGGKDNIGSDVESVEGGSVADRIAGSAGSEVLSGGGGNDVITGGAGDDVLDGGTGADVLHGNTGNDVVTYAGRADGVTVTLDRTANDGVTGEGDEVDAEQVIGTEADDVLTGDAKADTLSGLGGNDRLDGGAGADTLIGGAGDDAIATRDDSADSVDCGDGLSDSTVADRSDTVVGCELVDLPALATDGQPTDQGTAPADQAAPQDTPVDAAVTAADTAATESASSQTSTQSPAAKAAAGRVTVLRGKLRMTAGKVLVPVSCAKGGAACNGKLTLTMGRVVLGHAQVHLAAGKTGKVAVRLTKAGRKALRKSAKVNVLAVTGSASGDLAVARGTRRLG